MTCGTVEPCRTCQQDSRLQDDKISQVFPNNSFMHSKQEIMETEPPQDVVQDVEQNAASAEGDYFLEEEDDANNEYQQSAFCCTGTGKPITVSELWYELKDLAAELVDYVRYRSWKKKLLTAILVACAGLVSYDLIFGSYIVTWLALFVAWMVKNPVLGVFAFILTFVVATLVFVPEILLVFGAGYAFSSAIGTWEGLAAATLASLIGSFISAVIAFFRARYMMRDLFQLFTRRYPLVMCADRALQRNGFRVALLLRLCPIIPFNGLNYCCGITDISTGDFMTSLVGIIPLQLFMATVGATTARYSTLEIELSADQRKVFFFLLGTGAVFGLLGLLLIWRLVKMELQHELKISDQEMSGFITSKSEPEAQEQGIEISTDKKKDEEDDEGDQWFWVWA